jgi:hypothetical protein
MSWGAPHNSPVLKVQEWLCEFIEHDHKQNYAAVSKKEDHQWYIKYTGNQLASKFKAVMISCHDFMSLTSR